MRKIGRSATVAGAAIATTVAAAAASWAAGLPSTANEHAGTATQQHSVSVPGPNTNAGTHPDSTTNNNSDQGKGSQVSQLATTTTLTGVQKGAAISSLASGGQSQAGQHSSADANSGASTADTASGGASSARAGNASSHH